MTTTVPLSRSKVALIDDEDAERVLAHKWCYLDNGGGYACRSERIQRPDGIIVRQLMLLHRFIMDVPPELDIDHKNGNGLDCRRDNLREATRSQNVANSGSRKGALCPFKGVFFKRDRGTWRAEITVNYRKRHLGTFSSPEDAAFAYDQAALEAWGEYAHLNFPHLRFLYQLAVTAAKAPKAITNHLNLSQAAD